MGTKQELRIVPIGYGRYQVMQPAVVPFSKGVLAQCVSAEAAETARRLLADDVAVRPQCADLRHTAYDELLLRAVNAEARVRELETKLAEARCDAGDPMIRDARAAKPTTGLTFGQALEAMREGKRVRRSGWAPSWIILNGKVCWGDGVIVPRPAWDSVVATDWEVVLP